LEDVLPVESSDTVVITKAHEIDAILLSLNGDFAHIVNCPPKNYKGIVALQMHNHAEILPKLVARLTADPAAPSHARLPYLIFSELASAAF
jgi:hypothetical protein